MCYQYTELLPNQVKVHITKNCASKCLTLTTIDCNLMPSSYGVPAFQCNVGTGRDTKGCYIRLGLSVLAFFLVISYFIIFFSD
jgi:hypothetical protein